MLNAKAWGLTFWQGFVGSWISGSGFRPWDLRDRVRIIIMTMMTIVVTKMTTII